MTLTEYCPSLTTNFTFSLSNPDAAIDSLPSSEKFRASTFFFSPTDFISYVPSGKFLISWGTVFVSTSLWLSVAVAATSVANALWSYDSIAAIAVNIAEAERTFNNVLFFIII